MAPPLRSLRVLCALAWALVGCGSSSPRASAGPVGGLHASGGRIVDENGVPVRLLGVNRSGTEYSCIHGTGFFDGPSDQASIASIASWKANAVRIPLNEDCWLAINGAPAQYSGAAYQRAIADYVGLLRASGLYPILELHWTAPGAARADGQVAMPDRDHSVAFLVASRGEVRRGDGNVVFELFNEPFFDGDRDSVAAWTCWRDGGTCPGIAYQAAGMQELVTAVRWAGAKNLLLLGGVEYANSLSRWLAYEPSDPEKNLAAAWHVYADLAELRAPRSLATRSTRGAWRTRCRS